VPCYKKTEAGLLVIQTTYRYRKITKSPASVFLIIKPSEGILLIRCSLVPLAHQIFLKFVLSFATHLSLLLRSRGLLKRKEVFFLKVPFDSLRYTLDKIKYWCKKHQHFILLSHLRESFSFALFISFQVFTIYSQSSSEATDFCSDQWRKSSVRFP